MLSDDSALVKDIMDTDVISIYTHDDQEDVAALFKNMTTMLCLLSMWKPDL